VIGSAVTATSEAPHSVASAAEPQQVAAAATATMSTTVTTPSISPAPTPISGGQVAVVEVPNDDTPPARWDQWWSLPAPAPEPPVGALVVRDDGLVMSGRRRTVPRPRRRAWSSRVQMAPWRARSRSGNTPSRCRPTSPMPRPSRSCGRSSATTASRSTGH
jgi:hypothetical protein